MATTITAGNATNGGAAVSADNTGILELKTGTGSGTTALTADASQNITMPGNLTVTGTITAGAGTPYVLNSYVAPATWTKPAGLKAVKVTVVGAGGNGGSAASTPVVAGGGGGGGGGGAAIDYIPAPSIPGPVAVTAGPGTNSFGPFCSATAGSAGTSAAAGAGGAGGAGGLGSNGSLNIGGDGGGAGEGGPGVSGIGGNGGATILGGGGNGTSNANGVNGRDFGGGASGGGRNASPAATNPGGTGAPGIVIVEEFY